MLSSLGSLRIWSIHVEVKGKQSTTAIADAINAAKEILE
jgi:hypothetical protein